MDAHHLSKELGIPKVELVNDLLANAHGLALLSDSDLITLSPGSPKASGNRALISAGTGLGEAGLLKEGSGYRPFPSEGGHCDFAPRTQLEVELLHFLLERHEHVSFERVLSGPGLFNIYTFLRDTKRGTEPSWLSEQIAQGDPSAAVAKSALEETSELAVQALEIFASIYGAEAGNLALKLIATGGVFIGGGIAPKIIKKLSSPTFMKAFAEKGRLAPLMREIPVKVVTNDKCALLGAGRVAALMVA